MTKLLLFRMAVEFYMTNGRFLAIGLLACSNCKIKSLKGLDFSTSQEYILPEPGHTLNSPQYAASSSLETEPPVKREAYERPEKLPGKRLLPRESPLHREVILPPSNANQGKLLTLYSGFTKFWVLCRNNWLFLYFDLYYSIS